MGDSGSSIRTREELFGSMPAAAEVIEKSQKLAPDTVSYTALDQADREKLFAPDVRRKNLTFVAKLAVLFGVPKHKFKAHMMLLAQEDQGSCDELTRFAAPAGLKIHQIPGSESKFWNRPKGVKSNVYSTYWLVDENF